MSLSSFLWVYPSAYDLFGVGAWSSLVLLFCGHIIPRVRCTHYLNTNTVFRSSDLTLYFMQNTLFYCWALWPILFPDTIRYHLLCVLSCESYADILSSFFHMCLLSASKADWWNIIVFGFKGSVFLLLVQRATVWHSFRISNLRYYFGRKVWTYFGSIVSNTQNCV